MGLAENYRSVLVCPSCHQHVHRNPRWATELGFLEGVVR